MGSTNGYKTTQRKDGKIQPARKLWNDYRVPRVNTPVWKSLDSYHKRQDVKIANIQKICAAVGSSLAYTLDMLCKNQSETDLDVPQTIRNLADAGAMIGHVNTNLSLLRRDTMRPTLHEDYRNLCNPDLPITSLLFGDDLQKDMKDLKETTKIGYRVTNRQRGYNRSRSSQISNQGVRSYGRQRDFYRQRDCKICTSVGTANIWPWNFGHCARCTCWFWTHTWTACSTHVQWLQSVRNEIDWIGNWKAYLKRCYKTLWQRKQWFCFKNIREA